MSNISQYDKCSGCGLCHEICPKKAIRIERNKEGFFKALVDKNKCVDCGICAKNCPINNQIIDFNNHKQWLLYQSHISNEKLCSSGGAFFDIATDFLNNGWYVCGVEFVFKQEKPSCTHVIIKQKNELNRILGTKYIQSTSFVVFKDIKQLLRKGEKVLFVGTPCQVAALKTYIGPGNHNLFTIDLLCFGCFSFTFLTKYLTKISKKKKQSIKDVAFRKKINNKTGTFFTIIFENGEEVTEGMHFAKHSDNGFYSLFSSGLYLDDYCKECQFKTQKRIGDITLGDIPIPFYEENKIKLSSVFDINRGISLIGINHYNINRLIGVCTPIVIDNLQMQSMQASRMSKVSSFKKMRYYLKHS